ncbi:MAG: sigma-70 family RNA polymerase sigma factor, partial [Planctomycetota bacterium]
MNSEPRDTSEQLVELIVRAREGSADAMGELVESCRPYLLLIANQELDRGLQAKLGASDIVQETLLQARRDIATFKGNSQKELIAWLRQILLHEVTDTRRHFYDTVKRDARREQAMPNDHSILEHPAEFSSRRLTPSSEATVREEAIALRAAIATMPPESIEVIKLRNWRQLSWPEIGQ